MFNFRVVEVRTPTPALFNNGYQFVHVQLQFSNLIPEVNP